VNIVEAIKDAQLFRPFLADKRGSIATWHNWLGALRVLYGLPVAGNRREVVRQCSGREPDLLPKDGFDAALFLTGRRSGKSRIAAIIGAYESVIAGHEHKLDKGEQGLVAICAPTKPQSRIVKGYMRAIFEAPLLASYVERETQPGFDLVNGIRVEVITGDFRVVRGFTLVAAIIDEIAFMGLDEESMVKSDTELIRAVQPALATTNGKLIAITTPYAKKGWCYKTYQKNHANNEGRVLVLNCPSRLLNPTLSQRIIDQALAEDLAAAKSEYLGEFRDDVGEYLPRSVITALVVEGRDELQPNPENLYVAFCDVSGGRGDDAALAIAHKHERTVVVDLIRRYRPPFNPHEVCADMAGELRRFRIKRITGDNYAADFTAKAFENCGISYRKCEKVKSALYLELLPRLCSREIELLDNDVLVNQLAGLERRTRSGGKDIIDHPARGHDDVANAVAGVAELAATKRAVVGPF